MIGVNNALAARFGPHFDISAPGYWLPSLDGFVKYIVGGLQHNSKLHHLPLCFGLQVQHSEREGAVRLTGGNPLGAYRSSNVPLKTPQLSGFGLFGTAVRTA